MPQFAASDLVLHCLAASYKMDIIIMQIGLTFASRRYNICQKFVPWPKLSSLYAASILMISISLNEIQWS